MDLARVRAGLLGRRFAYHGGMRRRSLTAVLASIFALVTVGEAAATRVAGGISDHIGAYNFMVEISGVAAGYFKGVDGLQAELEVLDYQDGTDLILRKRPARTRLILRSGYVGNRDILDAQVGAPPQDLTLQLVRRPKLRSLNSERLCSFTLKGARIVGVKARAVKHDKRTIKVHDVIVDVAGQRHDCARYFKHPSART